MALPLFDDANKLAHARKFMIYLIWAQGYLPRDPDKAPVPATQKAIALFLSSRCQIPAKKGQVNGIIDRWPFPPRNEMGYADRGFLVRALAKHFDEITEGKLPRGLVQEWWLFSTQRIKTDAEVSHGPTYHHDLEVRASRFCREPETEVGRGGRPQYVTGDGLKEILRDINAGCVEFCEATSVLADRGDQEIATVRCRMARLYRDMAERSQLSSLASASLELGGRVSSGSRSPSDAALSAWRWSKRLIFFVRKLDAEIALKRLDEAFVHDDRSWIGDAKKERNVKIALDLVALHQGDMRADQFTEIWGVDPYAAPVLEPEQDPGAVEDSPRPAGD